MSLRDYRQCILVSALVSKIFKGQTNVIALTVILKDFQSRVANKTKGSIWHYLIATTAYIRYIDFSATGSHYSDVGSV